MALANKNMNKKRNESMIKAFRLIMRQKKKRSKDQSNY